MMPGSLYRSVQKGEPITEHTIRRLAKRLSPATIEELVLVSNADSFGRGGEREKVVYKPGEWILEIAKKIGVEKKKSDMLISGKELRAIGFPQGEIIGKVRLMSERIRGLREYLEKVDPTTSTENLKHELITLIKEVVETDESLEILRNETLNTIQKIREKRGKVE